jgi:NADPH:quinone reductase-like Zn-dependent oxidoreductase
VGLTSLLSLKRTGSLPGTPLPKGSPWASANYTNLTVVVTAGSGGTGFVGLQMAKAWGAKHIATSTTGEGIAFVKTLG